jgi:hypothetical protein
MSKDLAGFKRAVVGYKKYSIQDGNPVLEVDYELKPIKLDFLHDVFDIDDDETDPATRYLIRPQEINESQAKALQPYVIDGVIDLSKYDFMLECFADED